MQVLYHDKFQVDGEGKALVVKMDGHWWFLTSFLPLRFEMTVLRLMMRFNTIRSRAPPAANYELQIRKNGICGILKYFCPTFQPKNEGKLRRSRRTGSDDING
ncbi:hypothetical protein RvY_14624-2 [Ramazzottius varieornatus]|uniref:Uncharacterized protein n=1 Tax=Ramazzottius varieornatus TaxID=947166 RepID=A0A1D1VRZ3_RAMVA|nr:hypothetical protein RvY_14624-2 [Ramazzottius varieornatus]